MVNTKLDISICGPTSVFHFDPHPNPLFFTMERQASDPPEPSAARGQGSVAAGPAGRRLLEHLDPTYLRLSTTLPEYHTKYIY